MLFRALAAPVALAAALFMTASPSNAAKEATTDEHLEGTIQIDRLIRLPQGGATARIHVNVAIRNTGPEDLIIKAPGQCAVHKYAIVHPNNDPVFVKAPEECGGDEVSTVVPAGSSIKSGNNMQVKGGLLEPGRRYYVIYEYWGVKIRTPFRIFEDQ
jgi:hypothetical protein